MSLLLPEWLKAVLRTHQSGNARKAARRQPHYTVQPVEQRFFAGAILAAATEGVVDTTSLEAVFSDAILHPHRGSLPSPDSSLSSTPGSIEPSTPVVRTFVPAMQVAIDEQHLDQEVSGTGSAEQTAAVVEDTASLALLQYQVDAMLGIRGLSSSSDWSLQARIVPLQPSSVDSEPIELAPDASSQPAMRSAPLTGGGADTESSLTQQSTVPQDSFASAQTSTTSPLQDVAVCGSDATEWSFAQHGGTPAAADGSAPGSMAQESGGVVVTEGNSHLVTLTRPIQIPSNPGRLIVSYDQLVFDSSSTGRINDAFELALVDAAGVSVVDTFAAERDAYLNVTERVSGTAMGPGVTEAGGEVWLDISGVTPASTATLVVRLVNNDGDYTSRVRLLCAQTLTATTGGAATVDEGANYVLDLSVSGTGSTTVDHWTIDWGDGSDPDNDGQVGQYIAGNPTTATHQFADGPQSRVINASAFSVNPSRSDAAEPKTVQVQNVAPVAAITGPLTGTEGTALSFSSSVVDPAGAADPINYAWSVRKDGATYNLPAQSVTTASTFTFTPDDNGTYDLFLTVDDGDGGTHTVIHRLVVANVEPIVSISGPTSANEGDPDIAFAATVTDPGADAHSYAWSVTKDGAPYTLPPSAVLSQPTFSFTPTDDGSYVLSVVVDDGDASQATATHVLTVANIAPAVTVTGPSSAGEGGTVSFTSSVIDPAGSNDPPIYSWTVTRNGQAFSLASGTVTTASDFTFVAGDDGTYEVMLSVSDGDGGMDSATHVLVVSNVAPTASIGGPTSAIEGQTLTYTSSASDPGGAGDPITYQWSVSRNGAVYPLPAGVGTNGPTLTWTPADNGNYEVSLVTSDDDGGSSTAACSVTIANALPTLNAAFAFEAYPTGSETAQIITVLSGHFSDPGFTYGAAGTAETFQATIDWDDGSPLQTISLDVLPGSVGVLSTGAFRLSHTYTTTGALFEPVLTLTDDDGGSASMSGQTIASFRFMVLPLDVTPESMNLQNGTYTARVSFPDARRFDNASVRLGPAAAPPVDTNFTDSPQFKGVRTGVQIHDEVIFLTGSLTDGTFVIASDQIRFTSSATYGRHGVTSSDSKFYVIDRLATGSPLAHAVFGYSAQGSESGNFTYSATVGADNLQYSAPAGIASNRNGTVLWTIDAATGQVTVQDPRPTTGSGYLGSWLAARLQIPVGITTNQGDTGTGDVWIADKGQGRVFRYAGGAALRTGLANPVSSFALNVANASPSDLVSDGTHIWVVDDAAAKVFVYDLAGALLGSWSLHADNANPSGITVDPAAAAGTADASAIWILDRLDKVVYRYDNARPARSGSLSYSSTFSLATGNVQPEGIADPPPETAAIPSTLDHVGRDFWVGFPFTDSSIQPRLNLTSQHATTVTISSAAFPTIVRSVTPGRTTSVLLPSQVRMSESEVILDKGIHITADQEIAVQVASLGRAVSDTYLALPVNLLGTRYVHTGHGSPLMNGILSFIATEDETFVTVKEPHADSVPYEVVLQRGQAYHKWTTDDADDGLTGTVVYASKPIALIGGGGAEIPIDSGNPVVEQFMPVDQWGKEFAVMPFATRNGDLVRIVAWYDGTRVNVSGQASLTLNRGEFEDVQATAALYITSDLPIQVVQFAKSQSTGGSGDPSMTLVQPVDRYADRYTFSKPSFWYPNGSSGGYSFTTNYVNLVVPPDARGQVAVDGQLIPVAGFVPIGPTVGGVAKYYGVQYNLGPRDDLEDPPVHTITSPIPVGAWIYGFNTWDAYSQPAGIGSNRTGGPRLTITSPVYDAEVKDEYALITGVVTPDAPHAAIVSVTVNGTKVEAVDAAGNFFARVRLPWPSAEYTFVATDIYGRTTTVTHRLRATRYGTVDEVGTVGTALSPQYGRTSFDLKNDWLFTELGLRNIASFAIDQPVIVGIRNISDARVRVVDPDGHNAEGIPTFDFTSVLGGGLAPGSASGFRTIKFDNPARVPFTYDLFIVADVVGNHQPAFESMPALRAALGHTYSYTAVATDRDVGQVVRYSILEGPADMTIGETTGIVSWIPDSADVGDAITVRIGASDGVGGAAEQAFIVSVRGTGANAAPVFTSVPILIAEADTEYVYEASAVDLDGDALTYSMAPAGNLSFNPQTRRVTWHPTAAELAAGQAVTLTVTDGMSTTTQPFVISGTRQEVPPVFVSEPVTKGATWTRYSYGASAIDANGDAITYSLSPQYTPPVGMTIDAFGIIWWTPTVANTYPVTVRATDRTGLWSEQTFNIEVAARPVNTAPKIVSKPKLIAATGALYSYQVVTQDLEDDPLEFEIYTDQVTPQIAMSPAGLIQWAPTQLATGVDVRVVVRDVAGNEAVQEYKIDVKSNLPPVITPHVTNRVTAGLTYEARIDVSDSPGDTYRFELSGPQGMTIDSNGIIRWVTSESDARLQPYPLSVTAFDSFDVPSNTVLWDLTVGTDSIAPRVKLYVNGLEASPAGTAVQLGEVRLRVNAYDNVGVSSLSLTMDGQVVGLDERGEAIVQVTQTGAISLLATAVDSKGQQGSADGALLVSTVSGDLNPPTAKITGPALLTGASPRITEAIDVVGTASDPDNNLYKYKLVLVSLADSSNPLSHTVYESPTPPSGQALAGVNNATLARLDPTLLRNGFYLLRLTVTDMTGKQALVERPIEISGDIKLGNFRFTETDLVVPVSGVPITISRTYDTLNVALAKDMGHGWQMGWDLDLEEAPEQRASYPMDVTDPNYRSAGSVSVRIGGGRDVYMTLPDGRRVRFMATYVPTSSTEMRLVYVSEPGVDATLRIAGEDKITIDGDRSVRWAHEEPMYGNYMAGFGEGSNALLARYDFPGYVLTMPDGTELHIEKQRLGTQELMYYDINYQSDLTYAAVGRTYVRNSGRLSHIVDPRGNKITFTSNGIESTDGAGVQLVRDAQGRITQVVNPEGVTVLKYVYFREDLSDQNDLSEVHRLIEASDGTNPERWAITKYLYQDKSPGVSSHWLSETISPTGKRPARNEYDSVTGRLLRTIDADGNVIEFSRDPNNRSEIITDRRGGVTSYKYNASGDVEEIIDAAGRVTQYRYENRRKVEETINAGTPYEFKKAFTYDARGFLTSESFTVDGKTTTTSSGYIDTVKGEHVLAWSVGPDNTRTEHGYDAVTGLLLETVTRDSAGVTTSVATFGYDSRGNRERSTQWQYVEVEPSPYSGVPAQMGWVPYVTSVSVFDGFGRVGETREEKADGTWLSRTTMVLDSTTGAVKQSVSWLKVNGQWEQGPKTDYKYDERGLVTQSILPGPQWERPDSRTSYTDDGQVSSSWDSRGVITQTFYDGQGRVQTVTNNYGRPEAYSEQTTYDYDGHVATRTDRHGKVTSYWYDKVGRLVLTENPDGTVQETVYDLEVRDAQNNVLPQSATVSTQRHLPGQAAQASRTITDAAGRTVRSETLTGVTVAVTKDAVLAKRLASSSLNAGWSVESYTTTVYNAAGQVTDTTDAAGKTTSYQYDAAGRQWKVLAPTVTVFGTNGLLTTTRPTTQYQYDGLGRQVAVIDPRGNVTQTVYDEQGRAVKTILPPVTVPAGAGTVKQTYTLETGYDALGRKVWSKDPLGQVTTYEYDLYGNLSAVNLPMVDDPTDGLSNTPVAVRYAYAYDRHGQQLSQTDARGRTTRFDYDAVYGYRTGRRLPSDDAGNSEATGEKLFHDRFGRVTRTVDLKGQVEEHVYDDDLRVPEAQRLGLGRVIEKRYYASEAALASGTETTGQRVTYGYDALGRQQSVSGPDGTRTYGYNIDDQITSVSSPEGVIHYEYEPATGRLSRTYTNTAASPHQDVRYTYDALGRLSTVAVHKLRNVSYSAVPLVTTYEYDLAGNLKRESQPNGLVTMHTIDELGRVTGSQAGWMQFNYTYRADGRRSKMIGGASGSTTSYSYSYDALGRLVGETQDWNGNGLLDGSGTETDYAVTYTMDLVGNRTRKLTDKPGTTADETVSSTYNAKDWLQTESASVNGGTATVTTYGYDLNGSMTSRVKGSTTDTFGYDLRDRMTSSTAGGVTSAYTYDDQDKRVKLVRGSTTTLYHVDWQTPTGYPQVIEEKTASAPTASTVPTIGYVFGLDELMQGKAGVPMSMNNVQQFVHDVHGNVRGLWSNFGGTNGVIERYDYDAYHNLTRAVNMSGSAISFTAVSTNLLQPDGYRDLSTGLNDNWHRWYDPKSGRFTQFDPSSIGLIRAEDPNGIHRYLYAEDAPTVYVDPNGFEPISAGVVTKAVLLVLAPILLPDLLCGLTDLLFFSEPSRRTLPAADIARLDRIKARFDGLMRLVDHTSYTVMHAVTDTFHWMLTGPLGSEYHGWFDDDETKFIYDVGWVLGGIDPEQGAGAWYGGTRDERYMSGSLYPSRYSGFAATVDDGSNTIRHIIAYMVLGYRFGDISGGLLSVAREIGERVRAGNSPEYKDAYSGILAADLGEDIDDAFDVGADLDDFPEAFAFRFADQPTYANLGGIYGW